jgi:hypothetical protein
VVAVGGPDVCDEVCREVQVVLHVPAALAPRAREVVAQPVHVLIFPGLAVVPLHHHGHMHTIILESQAVILRYG